MTKKASPPEVRVLLNQEPSVLVAGQRHPIGAKGLGRVLLFLAFLRGVSVSRPKMARALWPGEPQEVASNRLRVSLTRLKAMIGDSVEADRSQIRLVGVTLSFDLLEIGEILQEALDEVDPKLQFENLRAQSEALRSSGWKKLAHLDTSGLLQDWDGVCRRSIRQLMAIAIKDRDWESVDFVWQIMHERGDMDLAVCKGYLEASEGRGDIEAGLRRIKRRIQEQEREDSAQIIEGLTKYANTLKKARKPKTELQASHAQLLGSALLGHIELHAASLAALMMAPEVIFQMQSLPKAQLEILEAIQVHLEPRSPIWVDIQAARLSTYASVYDSDKVLELSQSLFACEMTPLRASSTWMQYSFSLFHVRRWDEAIAAIGEAQKIALEGGETDRYEVVLTTKAAYFWHLGRVSEARAIYDDFLSRFEHSPNFTQAVNAVIVRANYSLIELNFGDLGKAREHVDMAYGQRDNYNLSRLMPNLLSTMGVIYARTGDVHSGVEYAVEGLKLTYARGSSRECQLSMEWACGVLVVGGLRSEAWHVMDWVNRWRKSTKHTRSVCEELYAEKLDLKEFDKTAPRFSDSTECREVMKFLILCLRQVQKSALTSAKVN